MKSITRSSQRGFSLIELSVATAIFSMGLGSLSLLLLASIYGTAGARHETLATAQAQSMAELIAMSSDAFGHQAFPDSSPGSASVTEWQRSLERELPDGYGVICRDSTPDDGGPVDSACDGDGPMVIKVFWKEPRHVEAADGGLRRVVFRLP